MIDFLRVERVLSYFTWKTMHVHATFNLLNIFKMSIYLHDTFQRLSNNVRHVISFPFQVEILTLAVQV